MGLTLATSCGAPEDGSSSGEAEGPVDDLPKDVPAPGPNTRVIELVEREIPPLSENMVCHFLDPETSDIYGKALRGYQGQFGHHVVLFRSVAPEPAGTVRDCTSAADMANLVPVISTINFGLDSFPEGMALRIPAGTQLVVQQHYVNTSENTLRVRDVLQLDIVAKADVKILAGFYGVTQVDFALKPDETIEQDVKFSCPAPVDMNIFVMSPHMHEWGVRIVTNLVKADGSSTDELLRVDPWYAHFRDAPPNTTWTMDAPLVVKAGDRIETTCTYKNTTGKEMKFPAEMCATAGYYYPAPEGSDVWTCDGKG